MLHKELVIEFMKNNGIVHRFMEDNGMILVPEDISPLIVLSALGDRVKNSELVVHDSIVEYLENNCHAAPKKLSEYRIFSWEKQQLSILGEKVNFPSGTLIIETGMQGRWKRVRSATCPVISFKHHIHHSNKYIFLQMGKLLSEKKEGMEKAWEDWRKENTGN